MLQDDAFFLLRSLWGDIPVMLQDDADKFRGGTTFSRSCYMPSFDDLVQKGHKG